jgi:hypothetical protein
MRVRTIRELNTRMTSELLMVRTVWRVEEEVEL